MDILKFAISEFANDPEFVMTALKCNGYVLEYSDESVPLLSRRLFGKKETLSGFVLNCRVCKMYIATWIYFSWWLIF